MAEDGILASVVDAVQGARLAFQDLCNDRRAIHGLDSRNFPALDVGLQALGNIVEILNGVNISGAQMNLIRIILAAPVVISASDAQISMADAMITDMRNIERRLSDVRRNIAANGPNSSSLEQLLPHGEVVIMRRMVEKYHSMISGASAGQIMCVSLSR
jgi:hypothetical protein